MKLNFLKDKELNKKTKNEIHHYNDDDLWDKRVGYDGLASP